MSITRTIICIIFLTLTSIYMLCSSRFFLFENFWKSYLYIDILGFGLSMSITSLNDTKKLLSYMIRLSAIFACFLWLMFNLMIINQSNEKFYNFCTSKVIGMAFGGLILVSFPIVLLINKYRNNKITDEKEY
jgi:hypothetical protein